MNNALESLRGSTVTRVTFEHGIRLLFHRGGWAVIREPFTISQGDESWVIETELINDHSARVLVILHDDVEDAKVSSEGGLHLVFAKGTKLTVPPSMSREAWSVELKNPPAMLVSPPGGG